MAAPIPKKKNKIEPSNKDNNDKDSDAISDTAEVIDSIPHIEFDKKLSPKVINAEDRSPISSVEESDCTESDESDVESTEANSDNKTSTSSKTTATSIHEAAAKQVQTAAALTSSLIKMAEEKEIFRGKSLFHHLNKLNTKHILCRTRSKEKASTSLSETFSEILKSYDKEEELGPEIFAHMTDIAATDPSIHMEVDRLDDKTAVAIIKPSSRCRTAKINAISNIMGLSVFSWIPIGTKSQKVKGQVVHIPDDNEEAITMISAMTLYLKTEKPNNHFLLQKFEQELLPGMRDNRKELKRLFDLGGKEFSFHFFKLIHNMVTNYIGKAIAD